MRQSWQDLLFAHWPIAAKALAHLVPDGVKIQEHDGTSWVGVVPFRMRGVMFRPLPDLPWVSAFAELNLRLYVEVGGKPGVWFLSLDAANPLAVWAARRRFHLPYFLADMQVREVGERLHYRSVRRAPQRVAFKGNYAPVGPVIAARPGSLEHFLTERYCLYTSAPSGMILRGDIHHLAWPLQRASVELEENSIAAPHSLALDGAPPVVHFAKRIDAIMWPLEAA